MKKLLLGLGAVTSVIAPIAAVVACGDSDDKGTTTFTKIEFKGNDQTAKTAMSTMTDTSKSVILAMVNSLTKVTVAANKGTRTFFGKSTAYDATLAAYAGDTFTRTAIGETATAWGTVRGLTATEAAKVGYYLDADGAFSRVVGTDVTYLFHVS